MRLLNASGCLDALAAPEVARELDGFVTKTVTPLPREGNAPPRIAETAHGMLNAIGLANPGRERFLAENLPRLRELGVPVWVSVGGFCAADYAETCARLTGIEAIELNLSCPNVDEAADSAAEIVAGCRAATDTTALREALRRPSRSRRGRARGGRSRRKRLVAHQHAARNRARPEPPSDARPRQRRLLRAGPQTGRARTPSGRAPTRRRCRSSAWEGSPADATRLSFSPAERPISRSARCSSPTPTRPPASAPSSPPRAPKPVLLLQTTRVGIAKSPETEPKVTA